MVAFPDSHNQSVVDTYPASQFVEVAGNSALAAAGNPFVVGFDTRLVVESSAGSPFVAVVDSLFAEAVDTQSAVAGSPCFADSSVGVDHILSAGMTFAEAAVRRCSAAA